MTSSPAPAPIAGPPSPRSRWRKRLWYGLLLVFIVVAPPAGYYLYNRWSAARELREAIAEADRTDPDWRIQAIEAKRRPVAADQNGATIIITANRRIPKGGGMRKSDEELDRVPPPSRLPPYIEALLRADLEALGEAIAKARELANMPQGHFHVVHSPDYISTLLPDHQSAREIAALLHLDIARRLEDGDLEGALISCQAMLNAGRSFGDEPLLITQLIRIAIQSMTVASLERVLGQGELPELRLAAMQKALEDELQEELFLRGIRGERACMNGLFENIDNGKVPVGPFLTGLGPSRGGGGGGGVWDKVRELFAGGSVVRSHAYYLRYMNNVVAAAKLPVLGKFEALEKLEAIFKDPKARGSIPDLAALLLPACLKVAEAERRDDTLLSCAVAALAAERFRLKQNRWPASAEELVKTGFLKTVPLDLYDGKPLRYRRAKDGLVIHSVCHWKNWLESKALDYRGDALDDLTRYEDVNEHLGVRIEFRLWDVAHRRQPPPFLRPKSPNGF
jgi:hypothetical protein